MKFCTIACWRCWKKTRHLLRATSSDGGLISTATVRSFRPRSVAHLRIVTCLTPFPTVGRGSRIRYWKRLSACYRRQTAALCRKTCWHYWMCRCWRRGLTSPRRAALFTPARNVLAFVGDR
ncbi:hypothetical protein ACVXHA_24990 [Escherichia coli]